MQPDGTYQLIEALGSCHVGTVWSAVDAAGNPLTVAVLDSAAAADQRWREAFASTANALMRGELGGPRVVSADLSASSPWVACETGDGPGAEQIFTALGLEYYPAPPSGDPDPAVPPGRTDSSSQQDTPAAPETSAVPAEESALQQPAVGLSAAPPPTPSPTLPDQVSGAPSPVSPAPVSGQPQPVSPPPVSPPPVSPPAVSPAPVSGQPQPISGAPQSPPAGPRPPTFEPMSPASGAPQWNGWQLPSVGDPLQQASPSGYGYPMPGAIERDAPRRRTGLWIGIAVVVAIALAAAGGVYAWQSGGGTPTAAASSSPRPVALPTASPLSPGVEPPADGIWPLQWPKFTGVDKVQRFDLEGLGFQFTAPASWRCARSGNGEGYVKYDCGTAPGTEAETGGELIVRNCPAPCDENRRVAMRKAEEAWGLRWRRASRLAAYAETTKINGNPRYGLVIVAFWRSTPDGAVDREVVMRMTAPIEQTDVLRKVANSVRVGVIF